MWTYIVRRLLIMLPTLFGVTVVSFLIMQLAPGDPLLSDLGSGGAAGQSGQTREAYLLQKRDLKLDKPLLANFQYFKDFHDEVRIAAHYQALTRQQVLQELDRLADGPQDAEQAARLRFLRSLKIDRFDQRLDPPRLSPEQLQASGLTAEQWETRRQQVRAALANAVQAFVRVWFEDLGFHGVPPAIELLKSPDAELDLKIGAIRGLSLMVVNPFVYTLSREPSWEEAERVMATWQILWEQQQDQFLPLDPDRGAALAGQVSQLADEGTRGDMFEALMGGVFDRDDAPFFAGLLLDESSSLQEKMLAAEFLRLYITDRVQADVPSGADASQVRRVADNWITHYEAQRDKYQFGLGQKSWRIVADTQYGHMVWRLATFDFGRSALRTREPVSEKIWNAVLVSAPLMFMAQLVIYLVAIPTGILCSVNRANPIDRLTTLVLFFLYSVPPFVAAMLFLLLFCYGDYVKWFPMERLHSPGAENFGWGWYLLDYLWHAFLPVVCLSLFSLAGLAMYARSSMLDILGQDFVRTARAKGVAESKVILKHALRNGLIPIITLFANFLPAMLGGAVLIEYIFNIPGMGRLTFVSIEQKDFPTLMALIYIQAIIVMLSILMTDLLYVFVDPRISFEGKGNGS